MINGKSVRIRVHPDIARIITKTAETFGCSTCEASMIVFKPATLPMHEFLKLSSKDVELRVVFNPK